MTAIQGGVNPPQTPTDEGRRDLGAEDARQGMTTGHRRRVLVISTLVVALLFVGLWFWYPRPSMTQSPAATTAASAPATAPGPTSSNPAAR